MTARPIQQPPNRPLPAGYTFQAYGEGDEVTWTAIQRAAEQFFEIEDSLFEQEFGAAVDQLDERMIFITHSGDAVGTITAWERSEWAGEGPWGQIHWVAIHPDHQRKGLSRPMMSWAMSYLHAHYDRAMLGTSTARIWALKVYLDYGFLPDRDEMKEPEVQKAWLTLQRHLGHPLLERFLSEYG